MAKVASSSAFQEPNVDDLGDRAKKFACETAGKGRNLFGLKTVQEELTVSV
jgi:hypothetical protein